MSKEEYLTGDKKDKVLDIIRDCLAVRLTAEETLELLKDKGFPISERTLRRFKSELHENSGHNALSVFQNRVGENMLDDILSSEEMERRCWKIINSSTNNNEINESNFDTKISKKRKI